MVMTDRLWKKTTGTGYEHIFRNDHIYLMNLKDSVYLRIIASTDSSYKPPTAFLWPSVWIDIPATFQEDPQWLANPVYFNNASVRQSKNKPPRKFLMQGNLLYPGQPLRAVRLYSVRGALIWENTIAHLSCYRLPATVATGVYCIALTTIDGKKMRMSYYASHN
jgi:hypothetical protein